MKTRNDAIALDRDDPLAPLRERFALAPGVIYLDGNSLGVPPVAAAARAQAVIAREWTDGLIRSWNAAGWTLAIGGLFVAGWSTYGFETAVCYTREFKNPKTDTFKAIFYSGLLCLGVYMLVPLSFQGAMGLKGLLEPGIYDGTGVAAAMAKIIGGGAVVFYAIVVMLVFTLLLSVMTSMMGSSRTLYQASVDGWLPRYLSHVNEHGAPTRAMWTDLCFNLILLLMSDNVAILAMSNVCYFAFVFLNLQAGWIHRLDRPHWARPFSVLPSRFCWSVPFWPASASAGRWPAPPS